MIRSKIFMRQIKRINKRGTKPGIRPTLRIIPSVSQWPSCIGHETMKRLRRHNLLS